MATYDHRAAAGVGNDALKTLLLEHWEWKMSRHPTWASRVGDRRFDALLPETGPDRDAADRADIGAFLTKAQAVDPDALSESDRLNRELLIEGLEATHAVAEFRPEEWTILPRGNPVTVVGWLPEIRPLESLSDAENLLTRYRAMKEYVGGEIETLRRGASRGRYANAESVRRSAEMARAEAEKPASEWAAVDRIRFIDGAASPAEEDRVREEATVVTEMVLRPALAGYAEYLTEEILPHARSDGDVGVHAIEDGPALYRALIRQHTGLATTAEEVHQTGIEELRRIHEEFIELGSKALGVSSVSEIFRRLRTDPKLFFETEEEVEAKAVSALSASRAAMPAWFGRLPKADCVVKRVPEHEAPFTTIAYYRSPAAGGSRPGEYRINVHEPRTRPRHEAEVLAYHETIPGHHLQIAIAQELPELPAFRRHAGMTAYVEGWALYTERLADEMGLYSGDLDRLGMLSFDAWRASRLVVDTGIHAMGWTAERAVEFMVKETPLAENNIENEVDRYVSWPGQALAYKLGQIEMWRIRRKVEAALGDAFDIRAFHDRILENGAVPLGTLARLVDDWLANPN